MSLDNLVLNGLLQVKTPEINLCVSFLSFFFFFFKGLHANANRLNRKEDSKHYGSFKCL